MAGSPKIVFCKYCRERCILKTSRTFDNPGREFWACPIEPGGHGWMEWVDSTPSPTVLGNKHMLACLLVDADADADADRDRMEEELENLQKELDNAKMHIRCLKNILKVGFILGCVFIFLFVINLGSNDAKYM